MLGWYIPDLITQHTSLTMSDSQYQRLYQQILSAINSGEFSLGRLPSERRLMEQFDGTRITIREALRRLEQEGVVYSLNRRGWFVAPPRLRYRPNHRSHFIQIAKAQGRNPTTNVLLAEQRVLSSEAAEALALGVHVKGNYLVRLRTLDGHPALYEQIWLNAHLTPGIIDADLSGSLTEVLNMRHNIQVERVDLNVRVTTLTGIVAEHLLVRDGSLGLCITQTRYDQYGNPFEYDCEYYRHDVIELDLSFHDL